MEEKVYMSPERVDARNAGQIEKELRELIDSGVTELIFDMKNTLYISSMGLRVFLSIQKKMNGHGNFTITNVPDTVREILDVTGFSGLLVIK